MLKRPHLRFGADRTAQHGPAEALIALPVGWGSGLTHKGGRPATAVVARPDAAVSATSAPTSTNSAARRAPPLSGRLVGATAPGEQPATRNPLRGAALDHIQEPVAVQGDEAGDQQRRVLGGGSEERMLIYPERLGSAEPGQMIDPWAAMVAHRGHGSVPANPEVTGHLRDREHRLHPPDGRSRLGPARSTPPAARCRRPPRPRTTCPTTQS
jgi:hypothetical protein